MHNADSPGNNCPRQLDVLCSTTCCVCFQVLFDIGLLPCCRYVWPGSQGARIGGQHIRLLRLVRKLLWIVGRYAVFLAGASALMSPSGCHGVECPSPHALQKPYSSYDTPDTFALIAKLRTSKVSGEESYLLLRLI